MQDADAARCLRQRLQEAGAGLEGGACCCQQQHRACQLECSEQRAGAHRGLGEVGDLGGIRPWHTHPQAHRQHGEAEGQPADDEERERPITITIDPITTKLIVINANSERPWWPNRVSPATAVNNTIASGIRAGANPG
jgi:hypothetical protein